MTHRAGVVTVAALVLLASCSVPRPGIGLTISGTSVMPSREGSFCQVGGCSGVCRDGPAPEAPLTTVRAMAPIRLDFSSPSEVSQIQAGVYLGNGMVGAPIESFTLSGSERSHTSARMGPGRYYILLSFWWSRFIDRGSSGAAFLVEIVSP